MNNTHNGLYLRSRYMGWLNAVIVIVSLFIIALAQPVPIFFIDQILGYERQGTWNIFLAQSSLALAIVVIVTSMVSILAGMREEQIKISKTLLATALIGFFIVLFWIVVIVINPESLKHPTLKIIDTEPPILEGVADRTVELGEVVLYRQGIVAKDNVDERVHVKIEKKNVDLYTPGTYEIVYTAYDSAGNTTVKASLLTVVESIPISDELMTMAQSVLSEITSDQMTTKEKLFEIYKWTKGHITYIGYSDKSDWRMGALQGFKNGKGDCFNYYSVARALLEVGDFEYMPVERVDSSISDHYWLIVKYEGKWYHFDATPSVRNYPFVGFLRSQSEVEAYTKQVNSIIEGYFVYDKEDYPEVEVEPLE